MKKGNAIFSFTLKNKEGQTESWYIDLKDKGEVAKGEAPAGQKADGKSEGHPPRSTHHTMLAACNLKGSTTQSLV